jgi:RNA polymerase sigma-70 factor (ECF subfamily)
MSVREEINLLFKREYGKLISVLTRTFGSSHIEMAEDVVQEAMLEAIQQWEEKGIPENPSGWIYQVAKHKALNLVNREKYKRKYQSEVSGYLQSAWTATPMLDHIFTDKEIRDDQLRMMFTCCHPAISQDSQVAFILKTLCGFSIPEISKAFLSTSDNINKRLVRARKDIRDAELPFEVPQGKALDKRLKAVLESIYLVFNEGYHASAGDDVIRYELCAESIRLTEIIASSEAIQKKSNVYALLALMVFNTSRFKSRLGPYGTIVSLEHQDRVLWDQELIRKGIVYLELSMEEEEVSAYHILATISAHYCISKDYASIQWQDILVLYDNLMELDKSPLVQLNRAVIVSRVKSVKEALKALDGISDKSKLSTYLPYFTTRAELHFQNKEYEQAIDLLNQALKMVKNKGFKDFINSRIDSYSENN